MNQKNKSKQKGNKILKFGGTLFFVLAFVFLGSQLFFASKTAELINLFFGDSGSANSQVESLNIVVPSAVNSLEPTLFVGDVRRRLANVYEPLVKMDRNFNLVPSLALSWGLIDDVTWEFNLRKGVLFHDGSDFNAYDVIASVNRAKNFETSTLTDILSTISAVEVLDEYTLLIKTAAPDPLLLQKLSLILIIPDYQENEKIDSVVGTGPYSLSNWIPNEKMEFLSFKDYWGNAPKFSKVVIYPVVDKSARVSKFLNGEADLISFVPYDAVEVIKETGSEVSSAPNLEVQFLLFNFDSDFLDQVEERQAMSLAVDVDGLRDQLGEFVKSQNQYVSNGVFGYSSDVEDHVFDLDKAKNAVLELGLEGKTIQFHLQKGLDVLGEAIRKNFSQIGLNVIVSYLEPDKFLESLQNGKADMYFFGFKSELGDSLDFLKTIAYSSGDFNVSHYRNERVDYLVENALVELNVFRRGENLKEAMEILVNEDYLGVPLIEYETVYATNGKTKINPRFDGLIYFDDLIVN